MTALEPPPRNLPKSLTDDATAAAPRIVNGLTIRPREKINLWRHGILFLPDLALVVSSILCAVASLPYLAQIVVFAGLVVAGLFPLWLTSQKKT
jgi:hypothetical protein